MNPLDTFNEQKTAVEKRIRIARKILLLVIPFFFLGFALPVFFPIAMITLLAGAITLGTGSIRFGQLAYEFKTTYLKEMIEQTLPGSTYNPEGSFSLEEIQSTELLPKPDRYRGEDLLEGVIDDVSFRLADARLEEEREVEVDGKKTTEFVTIFSGQIYQFTFQKPFVGYLQVREWGGPIVNRNYRKVKLESVEFNQKFATFATEELSAFYILTPDFMERILEFERLHQGHISMSFTANRLAIAIQNNKSLFEPKLFRPIDEGFLQTMQKDIDLAKELIRLLKLDSKLFVQK